MCHKVPFFDSSYLNNSYTKISPTRKIPKKYKNLGIQNDGLLTDDVWTPNLMLDLVG